MAGDPGRTCGHRSEEGRGGTGAIFGSRKTPLSLTASRRRSPPTGAGTANSRPCAAGRPGRAGTGLPLHKGVARSGAGDIGRRDPARTAPLFGRSGDRVGSGGYIENRQRDRPRRTDERDGDVRCPDEQGRRTECARQTPSTTVASIPACMTVTFEREDCQSGGARVTITCVRGGRIVVSVAMADERPPVSAVASARPSSAAARGLTSSPSPCPDTASGSPLPWSGAA